MDEFLQFVPYKSMIDQGFWHNLTSKKIDTYALNDSPINIKGYYRPFFQENFPSLFNIEYNALEGTTVLPNNICLVNGILQNTNTLEDFKNVDKNNVLNEFGEKTFSHIKTENINDVDFLNTFYLLTFADLKKYKFYYWCAFPAIILELKYKFLTRPLLINEYYNKAQISSLLLSYEEHLPFENLNFFFVSQSNDFICVHPLKNLNKLLEQKEFRILFAFRDPSTQETHPGWPLRNYLVLILYHWYSYFKNGLEILCFREKYSGSKRSIENSIVLNIQSFPITNLSGNIKCVGWERNNKNQLAPRVANLNSTMDPLKLCETAVDLNLKLMKWRLVPDLSLNDIFTCKCLLLGAGTLGCYVARCLLGWGIKHVTFVDNNKISFSNPVRQSLFEFENCLDGGLCKATTASKALKRIHPLVISEGINLSIPMPGHPLSSSQFDSVAKDVKRLESLIDSHDAVFLLMDTRESRWLPTLIGKIKNKIVISAALGFDSYMVIRHGILSTPPSSVSSSSEFASLSFESSAKIQISTPNSYVPANKLGCYFCNDVVAPGNPTMDRTLDQQCTVTRPGVSMLASATAVEILVSILTHPHKGYVSAYLDQNNCDSVLGIIPHQVRGFLSRFEQIKPTSQCFDKCTACSQMVLNAYKKDGFEFLLKVFNSPKFLEDLTGLTQMHLDTDDCLLMNLSDEDMEEFSITT